MDTEHILKSIQAHSKALYISLKEILERYKQPRKSAAFILLVGAYVFTAYISHIADFVSPVLIWPAAGIALAILYLEGTFLWPAIFIASFAVNISQHVPIFAALILASANSIENVVGVRLLKHFFFSPLLAKLRDVIILASVSLTISFIGVGIGSVGLLLSGTSFDRLLYLWEPWWLGKALSHVVIGSFLIRWLYRRPVPRPVSQVIQWILSFILLITICYFVFWTHVIQVSSISLLYVLLIPLIWMTLSIGPRGVTLALFVVTVLSISGTILGYDAASASGISLSTRLTQLEIFNLIASIAFLIFVSSEEGRKDASLELKEYVGQLEKAVEKISMEDQAKNDFLATLAHELRNPLAPIRSSLELLRIEGKDAKKADAHLTLVEGRVAAMTRLLDDLLDISRISQKKIQLQKDSIDLFSVLRNSAHTVSSLMKDRGHVLTTRIPKQPVWVMGDSVRLEQVFINLLTNAAKYTENGGTIDVYASTESSLAIIRIKDNGIGIPQGMIERIFDPFQQVEQERQSEGLGIGLSLAKQLLDLHDGTIEAVSPGVGMGSEFIVRIPIPSIVPASTHTPSAYVASKESEEGFSIFLVDDNTLAADALAKLLIYKGHTVTTAYTGSEAQEKIVGMSPDVVILDIGLPDMDGYEVLGHMKEAGVNSFFIALTGFGQENDKERAKVAGFDHHLTKPVSLSEIEKVLGGVTRK